MKNTNKLILSILALSLLVFVSCMERESGDVAPILDATTHPTLTVTPVDDTVNGSTINEVSALEIPFTVELSKPLDFEVNIGARIIGGTADENDFTYVDQVIAPYTTQGTFSVTIVPDGDVTEETEELKLEIGAFTLDNMFLVQQGGGTVLELTIENCADCFTCDWTIEMVDAYGDGWNGASITIDAEGVAGSYNMTNDPNSDGATATVYAPVGHNKDVTVSFNAGAWDSEITFAIYDASGNLVVSVDVAPPTEGVIATTHNDCP